MFIAVTYFTTASNDSACRIICMLCQQTSPKHWFANVSMTSHCDVTNSVYPVTMITTYATVQYYNLLGGHTIKQSPRASPDLCTPLELRILSDN